MGWWADRWILGSESSHAYLRTLVRCEEVGTLCCRSAFRNTHDHEEKGGASKGNLVVLLGARKQGQVY